MTLQQLTSWGAALVVPMLVAAAGLSMLLTPAARNVAVRLHLVDVPHDSRRVHRRPIPRVGGVAIVVAFHAAIAIGLVFPTTRAALLLEPWTVLAVALAGGAVGATGLYDDLMGSRPAKKLAVQLAAAALLYFAGFRVGVIDNPFGEDIALGALSFPFTVLWIAGIANALNLVDGLDGLAGGIAVFAAAAVFLMAARVGDTVAMVLAVALFGGGIGFLAFNIHPASVFMGDAGSLFLGTTLAALALRPHPSAAPSSPVIAMSVVLGIPIVDMLVAVGRRAFAGTPLFSADRDHMHHRLMARGLSHRGAVLVLWSVSAILAVTGVQLARAPRGPTKTVVAAAVILAVLLGLDLLGYLGWPDPRLRQRRLRNRERLRAIRAVAARLREAREVGDVYREILDVAPVIGFQQLRLGAHRLSAARRRGRPTRQDVLRFPVDDPDVPYLEGLAGDRTGLDRDTEVAIEQLCAAVSSSLGRLRQAREDGDLTSELTAILRMSVVPTPDLGPRDGAAGEATAHEPRRRAPLPQAQEGAAPQSDLH